MEATLQELDGKYVATLKGELDTAAAVEVEQVLKPLYKGDGRDVIIECEELEYIASSGLRILLDVLKKTKAKGKRVVLRNLNEEIKNVFKITGFINLFEFE